MEEVEGKEGVAPPRAARASQLGRRKGNRKRRRFATRSTEENQHLEPWVTATARQPSPVLGQCASLGGFPHPPNFALAPAEPLLLRCCCCYHPSELVATWRPPARLSPSLI